MNLVIVLNMYDVVDGRGDTIDIAKLSHLLDAPVVAATATKKIGMDDLRQAILDIVPNHTHRLEDGESLPIEHLPGDINGRDHLHYHPKHHHHGEFEKLRPPAIKYNKEIERKLKQIVAILEENKALIDRYPPRWLALKVFEGDEEVVSLIEDPDIRNRIREVIQ